MLTPVITKLERAHKHKIEYLYPSMELHFHGFFKPYKTLMDLGEQVITPFGMLLASLAKAFWHSLESIVNLFLVAPCQLIFLFNPAGAKKALTNARDSFTDAVYFSICAFTDTCKELLTFFTRIGGSLAHHFTKLQMRSTLDAESLPFSNSPSPQK